MRTVKLEELAKVIRSKNGNQAVQRAQRAQGEAQ